MSEPVALKAAAVVREAIGFVLRNWRLLLRWALFPLPIWLFILLALPDKIGHDLPWRTTVAASYIMPLFIIWVWTPFFIRLYRFIILGERPSSFYSLELFSKRTWRYIGKYYLVHIQFGLLAAAFLVAPLILFFSHFDPATFSSAEHPLANAAFLAVSCGVGLAVFSLMGMRIILFGPDAAVDGHSKLSRLGKRGAPHRWLLVKTTVVIWLIPTAVGLFHGWQLDQFMKGTVEVNKYFQVLSSLCLIPFHAVFLVAGGLIYKAISPEWRAMDAEEAAARARYRADLGRKAVATVPGADKADGGTSLEC